MPSYGTVSAAQGLGFMQLSTRSNPAAFSIVFEAAARDLPSPQDNPSDAESDFTDPPDFEHSRHLFSGIDTYDPQMGTFSDALALAALLVAIPVVYLAFVSVPLALGHRLGFSTDDYLPVMVCVGLLLDLVCCVLLIYHLLQGLQPRDAARWALRLFVKAQVVICLIVMSGLGVVVLAQGDVRAGVVF